MFSNAKLFFTIRFLFNEVIFLNFGDAYGTLRRPHASSRILLH